MGAPLILSQIRQWLREALAVTWDGTNLIAPNGNIIPIAPPIVTVAIAGTKDGSNPNFTIPAANASSEYCAVYWNGSRLLLGVGYTRSGANITAQTGYIPASGDTYEADLS